MKKAFTLDTSVVADPVVSVISIILTKNKIDFHLRSNFIVLSIF